jgi:hypothetical protein
MRSGYGGLRIFPREAIGCMGFTIKVIYTEIQCWYNQYLSLVHLVSVEAHLVFLGICLKFVLWYMIEILYLLSG